MKYVGALLFVVIGIAMTARADAALDPPVPGKAILTPSLQIGIQKIVAEESSDGTVTLSGPAPAGGAVILLHSDNPAIRVPASFTIAAGQSSGEFPYWANDLIVTSTVTVTASYAGNSDSDSIDVFPAILLQVASTGSGKNTLFWNDNSGGTQYNIYRSLVSGGPYKKINKAASSDPDPGPKRSNAHMYSDLHLKNGTEYFYYVIVVSDAGVEGVRSDEASDTPDPTGIPWDTEDAARIVPRFDGAFRGNVANPKDHRMDGVIVVAGPNDMVYGNDPFDNTLYAQAGDTSVDPSADLPEPADKSAGAAPMKGDPIPIFLPMGASGTINLLNSLPYVGADPMLGSVQDLRDADPHRSGDTTGGVS